MSPKKVDAPASIKVPGVEAAKIMAENNRLKARILELEARKMGNGGTVTAKVVEKKAYDAKKKVIPDMHTGIFLLSIYGLGQFPTSLYASQAIRLFAPETVEAIRSVIEENVGELTWKGEAPESFPWTNGRK